MVNNQFREVPLYCPHCNQILGTQSYFQSFESKVAKWLGGQVAPNSTAGFDVWRCKSLPDITIQVKYSAVYRFQVKGKNYPDITWNWIVKRPQVDQPTFFALFGIDEPESEHLFLLSRRQFYDYACFYNHRDSEKIRYSLRVSAKLKSDRINYNYAPKIWRYKVDEPEENLLTAISNFKG